MANRHYPRFVWAETLTEFASRLVLAEGVPEPDLDAAEQRLRVALPPDQRRFLLYTNGFYDQEAQYEYAWSLAELVSQALAGWAEGWLPNRLLPIGGDGAGGYFTLPLDATATVRHWSSIGEEEVDTGLTLEEFWPQWLSGDVRV